MILEYITESFINNIVNKMKIMNKGSNAHTINKVLHYINHPNMSLGMKRIMANSASKAYKSGDWSNLKLILSRYW